MDDMTPMTPMNTHAPHNGRQPHTVALFSTYFLEYSQTFIYQELCNHKRWNAEVFCARHMNEEIFPWKGVHKGGWLYSMTMRDRGFDRLFKSGRYSLVHGHFGTGSIYALGYARRHNLPLVTTFHGYDVPMLKSDRLLRPSNWRYGRLGPELLRSLDLALCASNELREMVVEYGVPNDRAVVNRLGVDLEAFRPVERHHQTGQVVRMVQIGRFVEKKGFPSSLHAMARLVARSKGAPPVHLTLVGGGKPDEVAALKQLVGQLGLESHVTFAGVLSSAQIAQMFDQTDVLVAPSVTAGNGDRESGVIVIKEAAASGIPAIATWHGGIPEIIDDGETGFLVPERAVDALAERMERLASDASLRLRLGKAARAKMEREYDNRVAVARLEDYYDQVVERWRHESSNGSSRRGN